MLFRKLEPLKDEENADLNREIIYFLNFIGVLFLLCCGVVFISGVGAIIDCEQRKTAIPDIPQYPNSTLVEKYANSSATRYRQLDYDYVSDDALDTIARYYGVENCKATSDGRWVCLGKTNLDGDYQIEIKADGNQTLISIYINWRGCSYDIE